MNDTLGKDPAADAAREQKLEKEMKEANDAIQKRDGWRPSTVDVAPTHRTRAPTCASSWPNAIVTVR